MHCCDRLTFLDEAVPLWGLHAINLISIMVHGLCLCMGFIDKTLLLFIVVFGCLPKVILEGHKLYSMKLFLYVVLEKVCISFRV
jgi:hypothetical protein